MPVQKISVQAWKSVEEKKKQTPLYTKQCASISP